MIFRKVSLERLSSPEQLDQMVQVTDPLGNGSTYKFDRNARSDKGYGWSVLDHGRLAESGNHAALIKRGGLYAEMWARQQSESDRLSEAAE